MILTATYILLAITVPTFYSSDIHVYVAIIRALCALTIGMASLTKCLAS